LNILLTIYCFFFIIFLFVRVNEIENKKISILDGWLKFIFSSAFWAAVLIVFPYYYINMEKDTNKEIIHQYENQPEYGTTEYYLWKEQRDNPNAFIEDELYEDTDSSESTGTHWVDSYYRDDGTFVEGYERSNPDGDLSNNLNYNP